jgi:HPt (histidine-containing phosphotransfer) domain-containing protein
MALEHGSLQTTLAAAAGDDPSLHAELRQAFADSLEGHIDLMRRARCDGNWQVAAMRVAGLAASFHADQLAELAEEALDGAPGDPVALRQLQEFHREFVESED